jgi:uncharacterized membrane protein
MQQIQWVSNHRRFHAPYAYLASPFGEDSFGRLAEKLARFFGTPAFILTQTALVLAWIAVNAAVVAFRWDPYPFILLNLAFSTQAAYAAPLILLAQTRQADRDKAWSDADTLHREEVSQRGFTLLQQNIDLLQQNTELTQRIVELSEKVRQLTEEIHLRVVGRPDTDTMTAR